MQRIITLLPPLHLLSSSVLPSLSWKTPSQMSWGPHAPLAELRQRIEQLVTCTVMKNNRFQAQMQHVLQQSEAARLTNETREEHLERSLERERLDKAKLMELMAQFKKEGAAVIAVMRESLKEANAKWKAELERNAQLAAQLRQMSQRASHDLDFDGNVSSRHASGSRSGSTQPNQLNPNNKLQALRPKSPLYHTTDGRRRHCRGASTT